MFPFIFFLLCHHHLHSLLARWLLISITQRKTKQNKKQNIKKTTNKPNPQINFCCCCNGFFFFGLVCCWSGDGGDGGDNGGEIHTQNGLTTFIHKTKKWAPSKVFSNNITYPFCYWFFSNSQIPITNDYYLSINEKCNVMYVGTKMMH